MFVSLFCCNSVSFMTMFRDRRSTSTLFFLTPQNVECYKIAEPNNGDTNDSINYSGTLKCALYRFSSLNAQQQLNVTDILLLLFIQLEQKAKQKHR